MNELTNNRVDIEFKPAELSINNFEELEAKVNQVADKYKDLAFTADDKKLAEQSRSELLVVRNGLDKKRKEVKKEYNKPLKEFESKVKSLVDTIDQPLNDIRDGLKEIEEGERLQRQSVLDQFIKGELKELDIELEELEQQPSWLNKSNFTSKGNLNTKTKEEVKAAIKALVQEKENRKKAETALIAFCEAVEVDPRGWLGQLDHKGVDKLIDEIKATLDKEELDKEEAEKNEIIDNIFAPVEQQPEFKERPRERVITLRVTQKEAERAVKLLNSQGYDARLQEEQLNIFEGIE